MHRTINHTSVQRASADAYLREIRAEREAEQRRAARGMVSFSTGFAWLPREDRTGRYVLAVHDEPLAIAVCDDFGELRLVPCCSGFGGGTVAPTAYFPEGVH